MYKDEEPYDPETTVYRAVMELEKKGFTKAEIASALDTAWSDIRSDSDTVSR